MQGQVHWWPWPVLSCGQPLALIQATKPIQREDQELKPFTVGGAFILVGLTAQIHLPEHFQWFPVTSCTLSWPHGPNGISPRDLWRAGRLNGSIVHRDRGIPPWASEGESFRATLEYLLEHIPQVLICVLRERVQILPHSAHEENWILWIDGYRKRRPWPVKIMIRGRRMKGLRQALQSTARQCLTGRCSQRVHSTQELYSVLRPTMLQ